jgi:hypothetical protein
MATGPDHSGSPLQSPISEAAAQLIGDVFKLPIAEIMTDARVVAAWQDPSDELLVRLARRHAWQAGVALTYLASLRSALRVEPRNA